MGIMILLLMMRKGDQGKAHLIIPFKCLCALSSRWKAIMTLLILRARATSSRLSKAGFFPRLVVLILIERRLFLSA